MYIIYMRIHSKINNTKLVKANNKIQCLDRINNLGLVIIRLYSV
jgi:hypothetical protein